MSKFNEFFITISAPDIDGFTGELAIEFETILKEIFRINTVYIVKENYNKWKKLFPHYHIYIKYDEEVRKDTIHRKLKKSIEFRHLRKAYPYHEVKKALDIRHAYECHMLLANYLTKQDTYECILDKLSDEFKDKLKGIAKHKESNTYVLKGKKCPSLEELPYFIINYNQDVMETDLTCYNNFKCCVKHMMREGYIMIKHIRNMRVVWATVQLLEGEDYEMDNLIDKECGMNQYSGVSNSF